MRILVCFRTGRELNGVTEEEWKRIAQGTMNLAYLQKVLNPSDEAALEQALILKDGYQTDGVNTEVDGLYLGDDDIDVIAKNLFAVGLHQIYHITVQPEISAENIAKGIAKFSEMYGPYDWILMGCSEYPFDTGLTPVFLSEELTWPLIAHVRQAKVQEQVLWLEYEDEVCLYTANRSDHVILAMDNAVHPYLRIATLREKLAVKNKKMVELVADDFIADETDQSFAPTNMWRVDNTKNCSLLTGTEEESAKWILDKLLQVQGV